MREIDLKDFSIRTDLIKEQLENLNINDLVGIKEDEYSDGDISVSRIVLDFDNSLNKKKGNYTSIYFSDITDKDNYEKVLNIFIKELKNILNKLNISLDSKILVVGLGNDKSTPDSLGVKTAYGITVTHHIKELLGSLEDGYSDVSIFIPNVMGTTGIESSDLVLKVVELIKPDLIIAIDALASDSIDRVCKSIQITDTGINPGSGIGNKRKEMSYDIFKVNTIAIGVPMVVDAVTIVSDTINYMIKHFSYNLNNKDNKTLNLIPSFKRNYLKNNYSLTGDEVNYFLGAFGGLSDFEKRMLLLDVLSPIGNNLMVTPKEVDFLIERLVKLLSDGINNSIHNIK